MVIYSGQAVKIYYFMSYDDIALTVTIVKGNHLMYSILKLLEITMFWLSLANVFFSLIFTSHIYLIFFSFNMLLSLKMFWV